VERARDYLERAAQTREAAEMTKDPVVKESLLKIAEEYVRMAEHASRASTARGLR
jgi:hypothetical protein